MEPLIVFILVAAAFTGGYLIRALAARFVDIERRIERLEEAQKTRNPYRTNDGLEDAMAIIHDAVWQADATLDYVRSRMRQVGSTLKTIRSNPDRYDSDKPNGKRKS
ncbi:MAG: hypothetical protein QMD04_10720 [Anaerolineales bacterium]|nr:hypothetical protein [Anaerolineales bacterium]